MAGYRIGRVYLENFKLISNGKLINEFSDSKNVVLLSGPNGFGKTTIFDIFELIFTNKISRILSTPVDNGVSKPADILFVNNPQKDVVLKVEFIKEENCFTIIKQIKVNKTHNTSSAYHDTLFTAYIVNDFDAPEEQWIPKTINEMKEFVFSEFGITEEIYSTYYHVKQHDNTCYLMKRDTERVSAITKLLNTAEIQNKIDKYESIKKPFDDQYKTSLNKIKQINTELQELEKTLKDIENIDKSTYFRLLPWIDGEDITWDLENAYVTDTVFKQINGIESFISYYSEFKEYSENQKLTKYINDGVLVEGIIIFGNLIDNYEQIKHKRYLYQRIKKCERDFQNEAFIDSLSMNDIEFLVKEFGLDININFIKQKIKQIKAYESSENSSSKTLSHLNLLRESLFSYFNTLDNKNFNKNECPFCGTTFNSKDELILQIEKNTETINSLCAEISIQKNELIKDVWSLLESARCFITDYLKNDENIVEEEFFSQLDNYQDRRQKVKEVISYLRTKNIDISKYINSSYNIKVIDIEYKKYQLQDLIKGKISELSSNFIDANNEFNFEYIYKKLFLSRDEYVRAIDTNMVNNKRRLLQFYFKLRNLEEYTKKKKEFDYLKDRLIKIKYVVDKLKDINDINKTKKQEYEAGIISKIEIPLHIYAGKIIQEHQRGVGVFVKMNKDNSKLNMVRFVADNKTEHDVLNTFSSGQIAAFVIAFTLAMNKVYANDKLNTIFIDDPVQTMDEINMVSFVETLRNEFGNKQIFLSTHENSVANFIRYKFEKYGLSTLDYNVKEKFNE